MNRLLAASQPMPKIQQNASLVINTARAARSKCSPWSTSSAPQRRRRRWRMSISECTSYLCLITQLRESRHICRVSYDFVSLQGVSALLPVRLVGNISHRDAGGSPYTHFLPSVYTGPFRVSFHIDQQTRLNFSLVFLQRVMDRVGRTTRHSTQAGLSCTFALPPVTPPQSASRTVYMAQGGL
jgi:hypothetical protein